MKNLNYYVKQTQQNSSYRKGRVGAGERMKKDAQIIKADLINIEIVLFVQLWHLRNEWHDAHKADLISLWSVE